MNFHSYKHFIAIILATVLSFSVLSDDANAQFSSVVTDQNGNTVFYSPDGSQSVSKDNLISPNHNVVLFGYQNTYTDVIDSSVLPRASGNNRAIASSETRIGKYYSTLSQGEIINANFDISQVQNGQVATGSEYWALSHLAKINQLRYQHGLAPVSLNVDVSGFAFHKAKDMVNNNYFAHKNLDDQNIISQYMAYNPDDSGVNAVGENLALAYASTPTSIEAQVFDDLLHSPGHYQNMVDPAWDSVGLGYYYDPSASNKVKFVQFFYTTNYATKNGGLSEAALDSMYWNYEFYQKLRHPEVFNDSEVVAEVTDELEESIDADDRESDIEALQAELEDKAQEEADAEQNVEETRAAQSEASEALAENQINIDTILAGNDGIIEPYELAEKTVLSNRETLNTTTDDEERARLEEEIAEAERTMNDLQPQMDAINAELQPYIDKHVELENEVTERAEAKRIAEETLMEKSEAKTAVEQRLTQLQSEVVDSDTTENPVEEADVAEVPVEAPASEKDKVSDYNVTLQNNIVELDQQTAPPAVEDVTESNVVAAAEGIESEPEEEDSELTPAEQSDDVEDVSNIAEDAVEETNEDDSSESAESQPTADQDQEEETVEGTLQNLPQTGLAENNIIWIVAGVLVVVGIILLALSLLRRK